MECHSNAKLGAALQTRRLGEAVSCVSHHLSQNCPFLEPLWTSQVALVVKNLPANAGDVRDVGSTPELG